MLAVIWRILLEVFPPLPLLGRMLGLRRTTPAPPPHNSGPRTGRGREVPPAWLLLSLLGEFAAVWGTDHWLLRATLRVWQGLHGAETGSKVGWVA